MMACQLTTDDLTRLSRARSYVHNYGWWDCGCGWQMKQRNVSVRWKGVQLGYIYEWQEE